MNKRLHLFEAHGVELEYMIVDAKTLDVMPVCDRLIEAVAKAPVPEITFEHTAWSNELVLHVVEIKTNGPARTLDGLAGYFQDDVRRINSILAEMGAMLLPTAMHPWMDPMRETRLWPHENGPIYEKYNQVFDCRGHGWSNLQSTHINLPFADDVEFGRLHAAIRLMLPILPALAASSPVVEGAITGIVDNRLGFYRENQKKIPVVAGSIVPEPVYTEAEYDREIFAPIRIAIAPHDPDGILEHQFLNSRGAIARFERGAVEIRVLDIQECPAADLAVVEFVTAVLHELDNGRWTTSAEQRVLGTARLAAIFHQTVEKGANARIEDGKYLAQFGVEDSISAGDLWHHLATSVELSPASRLAIDWMLTRGNLSARIVRALGAGPDRARIKDVYTELAGCLADGRLFD